MSQVFVLGDANIDVIMPIDDYPQPGGDKRSERAVIHAGGSAANTALALARLGFAPSLLACLGQDLPGDMLRQELERGGLNLSHLQVSASAGTGMMFVPVTPDGQRTLFGRRGANLVLRPEGLPLNAIGRSRALHLSGYAFLEGSQAQTARAALEAAKQGDAFVSLDTAYEPAFLAGDRLREILGQVDLLVLGQAEANRLSGQTDLEATLDWLLEQGVGQVGLKLGAKGSVLAGPTERIHLPAFKVQVVDTTGAGDNYSAGLLAGHLLGLNPAAAGVLATAIAGLSTTVWGAGNAPPGIADLATLIRTQGKSQPDPSLVQAADQVLATFSEFKLATEPGAG